ncbi:MAG: hypothetical protein VX951_14455 [Planctomycetota bacterium]|nr:hypothetical protein [Planctomycetota bacterium]
MFLHITSRIKSEKYPDLLSEKGGRGFPHLAFMDQDGNVLAKPKKRSVAGFTETLTTEVPAFFALKKKAVEGSKADKAAFLMRRFELGHLNTDQMSKAIGKGTILNEKQIKTITGKLAEAKVTEITRGVNFRDDSTFGPIAKKLRALEKSDGLPPGRGGLNAWFIIMGDAYHRKDVKEFERALTAMKKGGANNPRFIKAQEERLKELQGGKK